MGKKVSLPRFMRGLSGLAVVTLGIALTAPAAYANHQWSSYHWERDGVDPLPLSVGDNHTVYNEGPYTANWPAIFDDVIADWGPWPGFGGAHLNVTDTGGGSGNIESYNDDYGNTGWLGVASISVPRGKNKHIRSGSSRVNEYYIDLAGYDGFNELVEWRAVICQELGHTLGLAHNDEGVSGGEPDNTCMNTETRPLLYDSPNDHDTEMFDSAEMYGHDHGGGGGGGGGGPTCHPVRGCPGAAVGHVVWAEHYADEEEMFEAADAVVNVTVRSSAFDRTVGRGAAAVPITRVVLKVTDTFSGNTRPVILLEQTRGPSLELHDDPGYVQGDDYTLYLRELDANTYRVVNPDGRIRQ